MKISLDLSFREIEEYLRNYLPSDEVLDHTERTIYLKSFQ